MNVSTVDQAGLASFDPLDPRYDRLLQILERAQHIEQALSAALHKAGATVSWPQTRALLALTSQEEPMRIGDFARAALMEAQSATSMIDRLVTAGFVQRERGGGSNDHHDRRSVYIVLTPDGHAMAQECRDLVHHALTNIEIRALIDSE